MGGYLFGAVIPNKNMQKTTQAMLGVLLMITMSLSMGLGEMSVNDENVNHTSARGDTNCTSDEGCPDGYTCSSDGVCVAEETCDVDGDCPDGETCEDGTCENTVPESSCEDTNQETNEDGTCGVCLGGYGLDENGECVEDPSLDNSCTSDADCENGQICGAAGECIDAPDDSGNETNDGGDEPQCRTITSDEPIYERGSRGIMVCDDETGEWVELEDTRPTSVEIGCDEEPTEEQLDASNFADLLTEHGGVLIHDGDEIIWLEAKDNHTNAKGKKYFLNIQMDSGNGGYIRHQASVELVCESNPPTNLSGCYWVMAGDTSFNGSDVRSFSLGIGMTVGMGSIADNTGTEGVGSLDGNGGTITEYSYYGSFSTGENESGGNDLVGWAWLPAAHTTDSDDDYFVELRRQSIQIGMDENGNVTNANIIRSNLTTDCLVTWIEGDIDLSTNKDDGKEPEDESSNVLVAAGGVEVTTRDAVVAGIAAAVTAMLSAIVRGGGGSRAPIHHNSFRSNRGG